MFEYCRPKKVVLDLCTFCQLNCRDCYMRKGYNAVGSGYLTFKNFKKFLNDNPFIEKIEISNCGEPFLNPDLEKILRYAYKKDVQLSAWTGANFNTLSDSLLEALVKYKFSGIAISIDGASEKVYQTYRRKGSFKKVISNIKKLLEYKKIYNSAFPILKWNYIIMDCTQDINEIRKAKRIAKELGIEIIFRKTWEKSFVPSDPDAIKKETGLSYYTADLQNLKTRFTYDFPSTYCIQFFTQPRINWDGRLFGCCCSHQGFKLNVFEMGLEKALKSQLVLNARNMLLNKIPRIKKTDSIPCTTCWQYDKMEKTHSFCTDEEISKFTPKRTKLEDISLKFKTARIDMKNLGNYNNTLKIEAVDGNISSPDWFSNEKGKGFVLESTSRKNFIILKIIHDGTLSLKFKGCAVTNPKTFERIPVWIDYKNIKINGKKIPDQKIEAWHDKEFIYEIQVKDKETVTLEYEAMMHSYSKSELKEIITQMYPVDAYIEKHILQFSKKLYHQIPISKRILRNLCKKK